MLTYKLVIEYSAPTYYDYETNEEIYNTCDVTAQHIWVCSWDTEDNEIYEWIECFCSGEMEKAKAYLEKLKSQNQQK